MASKVRILAMCAALDDDALTAVLSKTLQDRPEIAPDIVNMACPDLTYVPTVALTDRRCSGTLKAINGEFGSIDCAELQAVFGVDVIVNRKQIRNFKEGAFVSFAVTLTAENEPQAFDLEAASSPAPAAGGGAPDMAAMMAAMGGMGGGMNPMAAMMAAMGGGGGGGGGGGNDSGMAASPTMAPAAMNPMAAMMAAMGGGGGGGGGGSPETQMMMQMKMMQAMGGAGMPGTSEPCRFWSKAGWCKFGDMCHFNHVGPANPKGKPPDQEILGEYFGVIKSYNPEKGFGFVACDTLKAEHNSDVFLSQKHVGDLQVGAEVKFTAYLFGGKLQCKDLVDATGQVGPQKGAKGHSKGGAPAPDDVELGTFVGLIKSYNMEKGFGFIDCPDLKEQGYEKEAFLHKEQIKGFEVGAIVSFSAYLRENKLRARNLADANPVDNTPPAEPPSLLAAMGGSSALDALMSDGGPGGMEDLGKGMGVGMLSGALGDGSNPSKKLRAA